VWMRWTSVLQRYTMNSVVGNVQARHLESEVQELVLEYRRETKEDHGKTEKAVENRNEDDKNGTECQWCHDCPCVWSSNRNRMIEWDENEHGYLASKDVPSNSTRRKYLYRQITLTISDGPLGKGNRIVLPDCVKDDIRSLLPEDKEGKYMGHTDE
jgi:hypothetical protein